MNDAFTSEERDVVVRIPANDVLLAGNLNIPPEARGLVLFAHGSGSSRHSPRNRYVASELREGALGTLLIDLLTAEEEEADLLTGQLRFDIELLSTRLVAATDWLVGHPDTRDLKIGYFGASTGAAAALVAAAARPDAVGAVVSRGGRPDLARSSLAQVQAPTLLIVGGDDVPVIAMNREAMAALRVEKKLEIVPGATHLFEEPGTLEHVARSARRWFEDHLARGVAPSGQRSRA
ncbi:MAG TPA: dienelactone hydrolase family protein [Acidimicrobiia bacterium]|nr:dienelactone hydrolase family protein [Acidimicrobiia bacterium]